MAAKYGLLTVAKIINYMGLKKKGDSVRTGHSEAESSGMARSFVQ
jgi:hypothetical protein